MRVCARVGAPLYNVHVFSLCVAVKGVNTAAGWLCVHPGVYDGSGEGKRKRERARRREREGDRRMGGKKEREKERGREKERERKEPGERREEDVGERSGVTFLIVSRPAAFCFGVYAS